jgi:hypothetical protein
VFCECSAPPAILHWNNSVVSNGGKQTKVAGVQVRRVGWVRNDSNIFGKKFPVEKESLRRFVVTMQQPVLLSPKFRAKFSHIFHTVAIKRNSSMRSWLFGLPVRILCEQSLDINNVMSMLLTLLFTCLAFFGLDEFGLSVYGASSLLHFFWDLHKNVCYSLVGCIAKSH